MKEGEGRGSIVSATEKGSPHLTAPTGVPSAVCFLLTVTGQLTPVTHFVLTEAPPQWPHMNSALPNSGFLIMSTTPLTTQQVRLGSLKGTRKSFPSPLQHHSQETHQVPGQVMDGHLDSACSHPISAEDPGSPQRFPTSHMGKQMPEEATAQDQATQTVYLLVSIIGLALPA